MKSIAEQIRAVRDGKPLAGVGAAQIAALESGRGRVRDLERVCDELGLEIVIRAPRKPKVRE